MKLPCLNEACLPLTIQSRSLLYHVLGRGGSLKVGCGWREQMVALEKWGEVCSQSLLRKVHILHEAGSHNHSISDLRDFPSTTADAE
jgi:hypothetical protein